ncbi:expressed unknown protein [Seminavis robusta]|uniref:Uncharacterized protein n=1 Tax=Seminavis robusta TaxID=568900 RepID=A0A9N8DTD5_9STRA|nr:expressed unknown protein [Seminavis robusta]|eukprot:Sro356_g125350.1 n/a (223) ;mRNA; f:36511-37274
MRSFVSLSILLYPLCIHAAAFVDGRHPLFGLRGGADKDNDYDRAEKAIFHGIEQVEAKLQKAVEDEVHSIFDEASDHHHRTQVADHAKAAVTKGSSKIKEAAREHSKARSMPFLPKHATKEENDDHKILHAIEAAETAVLHAVQDEVDSLFHAIGHEDDHPLQSSCPKKAKKTKEGIQKGLQKTKEHVEEAHEERKRWMRDLDAPEIDDYLKSVNSMYGMGF